MTTQQPEGEQAAAAAIGDDEIAAHLQAHPDFFLRHPDLVAALRVPHGTEGAISLIEHQVSVLRGQLDTERRRLAHLIARAREYENLSGRLHELTLHLIAASDRGRVDAVLHNGLCKEFNAEEVTLKLFPVGPDAAETDPLIGAFLDFLDREHSLCGPLDAERSRTLFGDTGERVASAALIPIRGEDISGVLAIGSADPERFLPDMGTELLDRMGEVVSHKLRVLHHGHDD